MKIAKSIKLFRGLSANEFQLASNSLLKQNKRIWASILERRAAGQMDYPTALNESITSLQNNLRLERQYFTDSKKIAETYAKKVGGVLVEIQVPLKDVVSFFDIEFQNFGKRKKNFEIVYCVKAAALLKNRKKWNLRVKRKNDSVK
jgi:hypothetical protein